VRAARRSSGAEHLHFVQADARSGPPCADVDCIVAAFSMHHFLSRESLEQIKVRLAPDGVLIVVDMFADEKRSFARFLVDQFVTSSISHFRAIGRTARALGLGPTLSPWRYKLLWTMTPGAKRHIANDLARNLPPTLLEWTNTLNSTFPGGCFRILLGSSFLFTWPPQSPLPTQDTAGVSDYD